MEHISYEKNAFIVVHGREIAITTIGNSPENFSYCFSLNSWVKLKMFSATPRTFSILPKNLMKNIEIHIFFPCYKVKISKGFEQ